MIDEARSRGKRVVEATAEAERGYVEEIRALARMGTRFYAECTPGYYNSEGEAGNTRGFFSDMYGGGPLKFFELLETCAIEGVGLRRSGVRAGRFHHPAPAGRTHRLIPC